MIVWADHLFCFVVYAASLCPCTTQQCLNIPNLKSRVDADSKEHVYCQCNCCGNLVGMFTNHFTKYQNVIFLCQFNWQKKVTKKLLSFFHFFKVWMTGKCAKRDFFSRHLTCESCQDLLSPIWASVKEEWWKIEAFSSLEFRDKREAQIQWQTWTLLLLQTLQLWQIFLTFCCNLSDATINLNESSQ